MTLMRKSELAHELGVSKPYISKLIREGKLAVYNGLVDDAQFYSYRKFRNERLKARLYIEILKGERLRAKVKEKQSKYIPAANVRKCLKTYGARITEAMLKIPTKLCNVIAATNDAHAIHILLTNEIRETLLKLCERH